VQTSRNRILTTHTGSLPRPPDLTHLLAQRARGEPVDMSELRRVGRAAVKDAVQRQRDAGIDVGNDGEQQRASFFLYLRHRLGGIGGNWTRPMQADLKRYPGFLRLMLQRASGAEAVSNRENVPRITGPVEYRDAGLIEGECEDFRAVLGSDDGGFSECFMTAPSPGLIARAMLNEHYATEDAYLAALGAALRVEYTAIVRRGFLLQIDAPDLALERHMSFQDRPLSEFLDFAGNVVATINTALEAIPRDRVRIHVCWGNYEGPHDSDVPLSDILPIILQVKARALVLPFANCRHAHEYHCLDQMRNDQIIIAGVIDTLTNFVEHPALIAERLQNIARVVCDPQRVMAGTDCGFDTGAGVGRVAHDVVWAKLAALTEGARMASREFWP
jgi:5-methyltetrahydropteroyltriglutamate--homocysteine methyltransferase